MAVVVVGAPMFANEEEVLAPLRAAGHEVRFERLGHSCPEARMLEVLGEAAAVLASAETYSAEVLSRLPKLQVIARVGVGFDQVDVPDASERGILVTTTQGANDWAVADHAFALMLGLCHLTSSNDRDVRAGQWKRPMGVDLWRKTIGIVGLGRIGKGMVQRAKGFQMTILAHEPYPDLAFVEEHGVELVPLDDLLRRSDFVSLHLPASAETYHLMDDRRLGLMKPGAFLVNTARGQLIDEDALERALESGRLGGAGLDVREVEPPTDYRFSRFDNVIQTAHIAGTTKEAVRAMSAMACQSVADALAGRRPHGLVNSEAWERRRR